MRTDTLIRNDGMEVLAKGLGLVEAEQFIMLIQKEPAVAKATDDYTQWQEHLFDGMSIEEISQRAAEYRKQNPY
jgi:hypothetical protein